VKGKSGYKDISWKQANRRVMGVARGLLSMGIEPGQRVAILSENRPEWAFTDLGCLSIGAIDVPIYATNTPDQCAYILKDSGARLLFLSNGNQLGKIMQGLNLAYTLWFNKKYKKVGHLWQGRYKSRVIQKDKYLLECIEYVELNPMRANLSNSPFEYLWNSWRMRLGYEENNLLDMPNLI